MFWTVRGDQGRIFHRTDRPMTKTTHALILALLAMATSAPALAQSSIALGERPIRRAEVVAFVAKQFAAMDANRDGHVSPAEFKAFYAKQPPKAQAGIGRVGVSWFEKTDTNGDGRVILAEAQARPLKLFDMADANGDGVASVNEQSIAMLFMGK